jgi:hypothetical protein
MRAPKKLIKLGVELAETDRLIRVFNQINISLPEKKARFFEDKLAVLNARRQILRFKYQQGISKLAEKMEKQEAKANG